ncbi:MAG: tetratricopeptide repeat protein [Spirochaetales bacterium]
MKKRTDIAYKRSVNFKKKVLIFICFVAFVCFAVFISVTVIRIFSSAPDTTQLEQLWIDENYQAVYDASVNILADDPFHNLALTYRGYSAFYLALSETDTVNIHSYIDTAINALHLALLDANQNVKPQIEYMLGKTYFHKNRLSAYYYYADLAIYYLNSALNNGYNAVDIYEYLGLSYASLNMANESIIFFTEALLVNNSDILRMAISEQYYSIGNNDAAKPYLYQIKNASTDDRLIIQCSDLLGKIYMAEGNYAEAENEFHTILEKDENSADAYYGLGLVYEQQGDFVKARAQWRLALEKQVNHQGAREKIGL